MLTSRMTQTLDIPGEPGQTVTIRKLSFGAIDEAKDVFENRMLTKAKAVGGIEMPDLTAEQIAAAREASTPMSNLDRATVIKHGVIGWTYDAPCIDANKADLDESTAEWLFDQIVAHSLRSADEGEASASGSTATSA